MNLYDLIPQADLASRILGGYVRAQDHPTLPLRILNYTEKAAYEGVWDDVTRHCRGLIYDVGTFEVVARPFPKFFNYGQEGAPELDLDAPALVTDKLDGSLGILYPTGGGEHAIATRGSFTSEQALHATEVWQREYQHAWQPMSGVTYLFEIIYPANRIVVDYGDLDDLVLLEALDTDTGLATWTYDWPGPHVAKFEYATLAEALAAEPRPNCEGLVVYLDGSRYDTRVKIKQADYVALHRILTGTNARNVWEVAAVQSCRHLIRERKHWGTYLGIDPARADEVLELGDEWLEGVPDEFHDWIRRVDAEVTASAMADYERGSRIAEEARQIEDRRARYEWVAERADALTTETMRLASAASAEQVAGALNELLLRSWRQACPEPTAPFARTEDVA